MARKKEEKPKQPPPAAAVTGAVSDEDLQEQARAAEEAARTLGVKAPRGESYATQRKRALLIEQAEEEKRKEESLLNLCRAVAPVPFEAIGFASGDFRWAEYLDRPLYPRSEEKRLDAIANCYKAVAMAWGIDLAGKWTSLIAMTAMHARILGAIRLEIAAEDGEKKSATERVN